MELIKDYWDLLLYVILAGVGGWYVPFIRSFYMVGIKALLSESVRNKIMLSLAEKAVKSTKNTIDDAWFEELKKELK